MTSRNSEFEELRKQLSSIDLREVDEDVRCIPTGVTAFDLAMGGGWPESRFSECYGTWQSGKSLLMYQSIRACQRLGGLAFLDDAERAFDKRWARTLGINVDDLFYFISESLEHGFAHLEKVARIVRESPSFRNVPILYVKDSLEASIAKEEEEMEFSKTGVALRARAISTGLRRLTNLIADQRIAVVFVNQLRTKIGVMFGTPEETAGGKAPKYYAGLRVLMKKGKRIKMGTRTVGMAGTLEVIKSKIGVPFRHVNFQMMFNRGIPELSGLLDYLVEQEVIKQPTSRAFEFEGERFSRRKFPEVWEEKKEAILESYRKMEEDYGQGVEG